MATYSRQQLLMCRKHSIPPHNKLCTQSTRFNKSQVFKKCKIIRIMNYHHTHLFAKCTVFLLPWNTQKAEGISDSTFVWEILSGQNENNTVHKLHSYSKSWFLNEKLETISNVHITLLVTLMYTLLHTVATMYCSLQISSFTYCKFSVLYKRNIQPNCFNNPQGNPWKRMLTHSNYWRRVS